MLTEYATTVLEPVCPDCGRRLRVLDAPEPSDWRDDRERILGANAYTVQVHRVIQHHVAPAVGDLVVYYSPWRGMILGTGPLVVRSVRADENRTLYRLTNPGRESDYYMPSTGYADRPISFEVITEYVPPVVEATLLDLLGGEWGDVLVDAGS